jgi:hypothetical protein
MRPNDEDMKKALDDILKELVGSDPGELGALKKVVEHIDHIGIGTFPSPYLQGDPQAREVEEARFHLNFKTGQGDVQQDNVHFWIHVPRAVPGKYQQPFPIAFMQHGVTGNDSETLIYAGHLAQQGVATIGIDMPEHGMSLSEGELRVAQAALRPTCLVPWVQAINSGRAVDYNGDGSRDSASFWWTSHVFHVRDNVRQGMLDLMQAVRMIRGWDGKQMSDQDYNGDGKPDLAGDFDGDGVPDAGGKIYAMGESLGGMMTEGIGGMEPYVDATAPMSGGAGMWDIGVRSYGVVDAVFAQIVTPLFVAVPAADRAPRNDVPRTRCSGAQMSVRQIVNEGTDVDEIEIACLNPDELREGMTVMLVNVTNGEARCARTGKEGRFRLPIPSSKGDRLDLLIYPKADVVESYKSCRLTENIQPSRRVFTFEQPRAQPYNPVADDSKRCDTEAGCQQFRDVFFGVGSPLVAVNEGFGLRRNTPELRRLFTLVQAALDPADNINYAPYYMLRPLLDENGQPAAKHGLLTINTVGDAFVAVSSGYAFARAAGGLPFLPPSAVANMPEYADYATPQALWDLYGGRTPNQVLIDNYAVEGIGKVARTRAGAACNVNYQKSELCTKDPKPDPAVCNATMFDPDWVSEGLDRYDAPHLDSPLRLARLASVRVTDAATLSQAWTPRLAGAPFAADDTAWKSTERVVGLFQNYLEPLGRHVWDMPDLCKAWDFATYGNGIIARFFASDGKDVYYLSHPRTHRCLATGNCEFLK